MEPYKIINAELIELVQKQKMEICEYRKCLINLNNQLMEEHEMRVMDKSRMENRIKNAISALIRSLDIDVSLNSNLEALEAGDSPVNKQVSERKSLRNSCGSNNIKEMCNELRRSSAMTRRSSTISPSRRSNFINSHESEDQHAATAPSITPQPRRIVDIDDDNSSETEITPVATEELQGGAHLFSIAEENDSAETVEDLQTPQRKNRSTLKSIISVYDVESPLRDVTNVLTPSPKITLTRGCRRPAAVVPVVQHNLSQEASIQIMRHDNRLSIPDAQLELSYTNGIADALHSTPNQPYRSSKNETNTKSRRKYTKLPKENSSSHTGLMPSTSEYEESSTITSGRPRRQCQPTSLKEQSLRTKMRNDAKK